MHVDEFRLYCLLKPFVTECFPFDQSTLVFKVFHRMFALTDLDDEFVVTLKCDPDRSIELQQRYDQIRPGYHMNKKHWITIYEAWTLEDQLFRELIDQSYLLVVQKLPAYQRAQVYHCFNTT